MPGIIKELEIPEINPIRFIEENSWLANFQTLRNHEWFSDQQPLGYYPARYQQKVTFDMPVNIQIFMGGRYVTDEAHLLTRLQVYNCRKELITEIPYTQSSQIWGNVKYVNGVPITMQTFNFMTSFPALGINTEGYYYLRLKLAFSNAGDIEYDYFVSEPIHVASEHPGTLLLEYVSLTNKLNSQFAAPFFSYAMRVEGCMETSAPKRFASGYKDQLQNPRLQHAEPYSERMMKIGYRQRVPMYIMEKINHAICCDVVYIDKIRRVVPEDVEIQVDKTNGYLLYKGTVIMYDYDNKEAGSISSKVPLRLYERNLVNGEPNYMMYRLEIQNSLSSNSKLIFVGFEITSTAQEDAFINVINGYWLAVRGLYGFIQRVGDYIVYNNGGGEFYDISNSIILTKKFDLLYNKALAVSAIPQITLNLTLKGTKAAVVPYNYYEVQTLHLTTATVLFNYKYPGFVQTAQVRVWHDDTIEELYISNARTFYQLQAGSMPLGLTKISFSGTSLATLDFSAIDNTLEYLMIADSKLTGLTSLDIKDWSALTTIQLHNNLLGSNAVDDIFIDHQASTTLPPSGVFNIKFQTPAAPPTAASATERADLVTAGWIVLTD